MAATNSPRLKPFHLFLRMIKMIVVPTFCTLVVELAGPGTLKRIAAGTKSSLFHAHDPVACDRLAAATQTAGGVGAVGTATTRPQCRVQEPAPKRVVPYQWCRCHLRIGAKNYVRRWGPSPAFALRCRKCPPQAEETTSLPLRRARGNGLQAVGTSGTCAIASGQRCSDVSHSGLGVTSTGETGRTLYLALVVFAIMAPPSMMIARGPIKRS